MKENILEEAYLTRKSPNALNNIHRLREEAILELKCKQILTNDPIKLLKSAQSEIGKFGKSVVTETKADFDWKLFKDFQTHERRIAYERDFNWYQVQKVYKNDAHSVLDSLRKQNNNLGIDHKLNEALRLNLEKIKNEALKGSTKLSITEVSYDLLKKRKNLDDTKFHALTMFERDCENAFSKLEWDRRKIPGKKLFEESHKAIMDAISHEKRFYNTVIDKELFKDYTNEYKNLKENINPYKFEHLEKLSNKGVSVVESLQSERKKNTFFSISQDGKLTVNVQDRLFSSDNKPKVNFNQWKSEISLNEAKKSFKISKKFFPLHPIAEESNNIAVNTIKTYNPKKIDFTWHVTNPPNFARLSAENFLNTINSTSSNESLSPLAGPSSPIISAPPEKEIKSFPLDDRSIKCRTSFDPYPWESKKKK